MEEKLKKLSKEQLREIILELADLLPQKERKQLNVLLMKAAADSQGTEKTLPSKAASITASNVSLSFPNDAKNDGELSNMISFETKILEESQQHKTSVF